MVSNYFTYLREQNAFWVRKISKTLPLKSVSLRTYLKKTAFRYVIASRSGSIYLLESKNLILVSKILRSNAMKARVLLTKIEKLDFGK